MYSQPCITLRHVAAKRNSEIIQLTLTGSGEFARLATTEALLNAPDVPTANRGTS